MGIALKECTDNLPLSVRIKIAIQLLFRVRYDLFLSEKTGKDLFKFFIKNKAKYLF